MRTIIAGGGPAGMMLGLLLARAGVEALVLDERLQPPLFFRLLSRFPSLRRIPGRLIGLGVRPEHVNLD